MQILQVSDVLVINCKNINYIILENMPSGVDVKAHMTTGSISLAFYYHSSNHAFFKAIAYLEALSGLLWQTEADWVDGRSLYNWAINNWEPDESKNVSIN